jgi:DNA invertase Pin-like site-specific DNA recombinase
MLREIRRNPNVNVVFYDFSRFSRDTRRALNAFDELNHLGVRAISVCNPGVDCSTASGRSQLRIELSYAEDFSDQLSEKQQLRMKHAILSGRWIAHRHLLATETSEPRQGKNQTLFLLSPPPRG